MNTLQVEVEDFVSAARTMHHDIAESVRITLDGVAGTLHANTDLVGEDPAGSSWASAYDPAARSVLEATAQIINAAFRTSQLFAQSGANYEQAEAASTVRGQQANRPELAQLAAAQPKTHAPRLPSAAGAGNGTPAGWWLVEHTVGYVWPGGHQDRLRATADGWRRAAGGIENVAFEPVLITALFARDKLPEADDIATICTGFHNRLNDVARGYRALARACDEYADQLDECHEAVRSELTELMAESAGIQLVGAFASIFSFGAAEAPTQAAQAGRIAAAAARIGGLIEKVVVCAKRVSGTIAHVAKRADQIAGDLAKLSGVPLTVAIVHGVRGLPAVVRARELAATNRLSVRASGLASLTAKTSQLEKKFKRANLFGIASSPNPHAFAMFEKALADFVRHPDTVRVGSHVARYKGEAAIINYNARSGMMVLQHLDGALWSAWRLSASQLKYVRKYGELR